MDAMTSSLATASEDQHIVDVLIEERAHGLQRDVPTTNDVLELVAKLVSPQPSVFMDAKGHIHDGGRADPFRAEQHQGCLEPAVDRHHSGPQRFKQRGRHRLDASSGGC